MPENYIQFTNGDVIDQNEVNVDADDIPLGLVSSSGGAAGYNDVTVTTTSPTGQQQQQQYQHTDTMGSGASNYSATDYEVQRTVNGQPTVPGTSTYYTHVYNSYCSCTNGTLH